MIRKSLMSLCYILTPPFCFRPVGIASWNEWRSILWVGDPAKLITERISYGFALHGCQSGWSTDASITSSIIFSAQRLQSADASGATSSDCWRNGQSDSMLCRIFHIINTSQPRGVAVIASRRAPRTVPGVGRSMVHANTWCCGHWDLGSDGLGCFAVVQGHNMAVMELSTVPEAVRSVGVTF